MSHKRRFLDTSGMPPSFPADAYGQSVAGTARRRRLSLAARAGVLAATAGTALLATLGCRSSKGDAAPSPPEVQVATVIQKDVPVIREWIGTLDGSVNAEIRPQVEGYLMKRTYREGAFVRRGETLFEIDPRQFRAALDQAEGALAREEAALARARIDVARFTPLAAEKAVSQQELDNAMAAQSQAEANVAAAQAAVDRERLNLSWTRVVSPIDGIAGISTAQVGDLVNGQRVMTTVSTVDPIKAYFNLSEREYMDWARRWGAMDRSGPPPGGAGMFQLVMSDGSLYPLRGDPALTDRNVDVKTGTIKVAAVFPNPDHLLRPGQYGKVRLEVEVKRGALLVPERALSEMQGVRQVIVVGADNKAEVRPIETGEHVGALWTVEKGLSPGERIVVEGLQKVRTGIVVDPKAVEAERTGGSGGAAGGRAPAAGGTSGAASTPDGASGAPSTSGGGSGRLAVPGGSTGAAQIAASTSGAASGGASAADISSSTTPPSPPSSPAAGR